MGKHRNRDRDRAIGARICLARVRAGMSRPALGVRIGITAQQVARYEGGLVRLPASMLDDLAAALTSDVRPCAPVWFLETDRAGLAAVELLDLPAPGSVARRQLDRALEVLDGRRPPPFADGAAGPAP